MSAHDISSGRQNSRLGNHSRRRRTTHGPREARVRSTHGLLAPARLQHVRATVWRRPSPPRLLVPGSIPLPRVRATDLPRKPPRHRDVSAILPAQALPCGLPRQHLAEHIGRRQPRPRLAHLRRFRSSVDRSCAKAVRRRAHGRGTGTDRLCAGQHHDRPLPEPVPVGAVSSAQRGGEAAHARGPARQHPHFRADYPRENPRRHRPRPSADRAGFVLRDGSRVRRFSTSSSVHDRVRRSS